VTSVGDHAFEDCTAATSISIGTGLQTISRYCFADCDSITSITIPGSVDLIGDYAFAGCTSLATVTINENTNLIPLAIDTYVFASCRALKTVYLPGELFVIGNNAFGDTTDATINDYVNNGNNPVVTQIETVYFNAPMTTWYNVIIDGNGANPMQYSSKTAIFYTLETGAAVDYSIIETIDVEYLGGGTVEIKPLKAVDHESRDIVNPTLIINGKPITFNVTLSSGHTLELDFDGNCRVIDKEFNVLSTPSYKGEIPLMKNGENKIEFSSQSEKQDRVRVTLGVYGDILD
jgi:hypothetical protein